MKIFIVAMPGSGNLGDDLISIRLAKMLCDYYNPDEIGVLCGENNIKDDYNIIDTSITFFKKPRKTSFKDYFGRSFAIKSFVKSADLIVIGGGGLFQDTHSPFTIHNYLKYLRLCKCKVMIVGMGVGPIQYKINQFYISRVLNVENISIQVRDMSSYDYIKRLNIENTITLDSDIIEGTQLKSLLPSTIHKETSSNVLGCNIRNWPDINIDELTYYIKKIVDIHKIEEVKFFAFENGVNNNREKVFSEIIMQELFKITDIPISMYSYNDIPIEIFYENFFSVDYALASRYHANILWQKAGIPTIPIAYAPKVLSLYNQFKKPVYNFRKLIEKNISEFVILNEIHTIKDYSLPDLPKEKVIVKHRVKLLMFFFGLGGFLYSLYRSIKVRIK